MKCRFSFVANSSSTSFLIDLPQNFEPYEHFKGFTYEKASKKFMKALEHLLKNGFLESSDTNYETFSELETALEPYVVTEYETGSDHSSALILIDTTRRLQK